MRILLSFREPTETILVSFQSTFIITRTRLEIMDSLETGRAREKMRTFFPRYYPNYYPPTYLGYFDGRPASLAQLENDYKFAKGGHYPYNRADNLINIGLQQTSLPTCLHDLFYCVRASVPQNQQYQRYYNKVNKEISNQLSQKNALLFMENIPKSLFLQMIHICLLNVETRKDRHSCDKNRIS